MQLPHLATANARGVGMQRTYEEQRAWMLGPGATRSCALPRYCTRMQLGLQDRVTDLVVWRRYAGISRQAVYTDSYMRSVQVILRRRQALSKPASGGPSSWCCKIRQLCSSAQPSWKPTERKMMLAYFKSRGEV